MENNTRMKQGQLDVKRAEIQLKREKDARYPNLNSSMNHGYNWGQSIDPFTNEFAAGRVRSNTVNLTSQFTIFDGLQTKYKIKKSEVNGLIQELGVEIDQRNHKIEITGAYLQVMLTKRLFFEQKEKHRSTEIQQGRMKHLVQAGRKTTSELLEVEAQLGLDELNTVKAKNELKMSLLALQYLIQAPKEELFTVSDSILENQLDSGVEIDFKSLPEIKQLNKRLEVADLQLDLTKGKRYPRLYLNGQIGTGYSGNNKELLPDQRLVTKALSRQFKENLYQSASLTLQIPIFNKREILHDLADAEIEYNMLNLEKELIVLQLRNKIEQLKIDIQNANQELVFSQKAILHAQMNADNAQLKFEEGVIDFSKLNESNVNLLLAKSNGIQAFLKKEFKKTMLKMFQY